MDFFPILHQLNYVFLALCSEVMENKLQDAVFCDSVRLVNCQHTAAALALQKQATLRAGASYDGIPSRFFFFFSVIDKVSGFSTNLSEETIPETRGVLEEQGIKTEYL